LLILILIVVLSAFVSAAGRFDSDVQTFFSPTLLNIMVSHITLQELRQKGYIGAWMKGNSLLYNLHKVVPVIKLCQEMQLTFVCKKVDTPEKLNRPPHKNENYLTGDATRFSSLKLTELALLLLVS
jgi:hypothetical protein